MIATAPDSQIGPKQLGLLYNRALQQYGVFSGEISFKMKSNPVAATFDPNLYPGLKRIVAPSVYVVNTRTPAEFMTVMKRLQARSDVAWVEPTITYTAVK